MRFGLRGWTAGIAVAGLWAGSATGNELTARADGTDSAASAHGCVRIDAGTQLALVLAESVSSAQARPGDAVALRTAEPVTCKGGVGLPADLPVTGEVLHASPAGTWRSAGELVIVARHLEWQGRRYGVRALDLGGSAVSSEIPAARQMFTFQRGSHDRVFEAGMRASAKLVESIVLSPPLDSIETSR